MKTRAASMTCAAAMVAVMGLGVVGAPGRESADEQAAQPEDAGPTPPDLATIRARREEAMKRLAPLVGEWEVEGTMGTPDEGGERPRQVGTWSNRWLMGGKHLELSFDVEVGGGSTQWIAIVSYNPYREHYESIWIGSGGYRFAETGNFDEDGSLVLTSHQDGPDLSNPSINVSTFVFVDDGTITVTDTQTDRENPVPVMSFFARLTPVE